MPDPTALTNLVTEPHEGPCERNKNEVEEWVEVDQTNQCAQNKIESHDFSFLQKGGSTECLRIHAAGQTTKNIPTRKLPRDRRPEPTFE